MVTLCFNKMSQVHIFSFRNMITLVNTSHITYFELFCSLKVCRLPSGFLITNWASLLLTKTLQMQTYSGLLVSDQYVLVVPVDSQPGQQIFISTHGAQCIQPVHCVVSRSTHEFCENFAVNLHWSINVTLFYVSLICTNIIAEHPMYILQERRSCFIVHSFFLKHAIFLQSPY